MDYTPNFFMGQEVWMVHSETFHRIVKCSACSNTGQIVIAEEKFICPKCHGRSAHEQYAGEKFYVRGSSMVGKITIEDYPTNYHKDDPNPKYTYMLFETGVGSGQIWEQERLFASKSEAQSFCDVRNGVLRADECELLPAPVDNYGRVRTSL